MTWQRSLARAGRHPSALLLVLQLAAVVSYPFIDRSAVGRAVLAGIGTLVLITTTAMVRRTPWMTWVSVVLALPAIALLALQAVWHAAWLLPLSAALEAAFYFYAAGSLIAYMWEDRKATTDELYCAGATFTLLAWGFAYVFLLLQVLQPGSFAAAVNPADPRSFTELIYLSFALLSSTGIGDVIPLKPLARALCTLEMFAGVMYLTLVVSRLIGLSLLAQDAAP